MRRDGLRDPERAEEVELHRRAGLFLAELLDGPEPHRPGVVDDDVEPAEARDRLLDGGEHSRAVGHVGGEDQRAIAVERRRRARDRHDTIARGERRLGERTAEPSAGARDQPYAWCSGHAQPPYRDETSRIEWPPCPGRGAIRPAEQSSTPRSSSSARSA